MQLNSILKYFKLIMLSNSNSKKKLLRQKLLKVRHSITEDFRFEKDKKISKNLTNILSKFDGNLGFYWPIKGEYDVVPVVSKWLLTKTKRKAALPVIIQKQSPMKFLEWSKRTKLEKGMFNLDIPPLTADEIMPELIIVPCVGFDSKNYRLGYGGGYYDRTLEKFTSAKKIGICYLNCRVSDIEPEEFDIPMDLVICS